jgi:2-polyprenyl-3-methyl-5-hydroxy-6-metoxy-1,4-benzoquinol methylase
MTIAGMHDAVIDHFSVHVRPPARVMDLGAGAGAWAGRLVRAGYEVVGVDRAGDRFACAEATFVTADLNGDFTQGVAGQFDAVTAIEVIEHLENPRHLLRQAKQVLKPGGFMFVTTPNIECVPARLRYLIRGDLRMFGRDPAFNDPTHITPIHTQMFERMLADVGFELVDHGFNRPEPTVTHAAWRFLSRTLAPFVKGVTGGDCHIFVLRPK